MIDAYEVGQKLTADDFISPLYFPPMKWEYAEVEEITDDTVTLHYYDYNEPQTDQIQTFSRADMAEMLGWDISADEVTDVIVDAPDTSIPQNTPESQPEAAETPDFIAKVLGHATIGKRGSYELLDGSPAAYVLVVEDGFVKRAFIFKTRRACEKCFNRIGRLNG